MTDAKTETLPLHTTVESAIADDAGWMLWEGQWRLSTIIYDAEDDVLYVAAVINDQCRPFELDDVENLPWMPISRPPYGADEKPCTHAVTIRDHGASVTFSWNMNVSDGRASMGRIIQAVESMLRETDAPVSVG